MPDNFDIHREEGPSGGRYILILDGYEAEMTYSRAGDGIIIIDHTSVPKELGGRGAGKALVQLAVEDARKDARKIVPLCPFAKAQIEKHKEWQDVLK